MSQERPLEAPGLVCPYRTDVVCNDEMETARCRLLTEITSVDDAQLCQVRRDACEACSANEQRPSPTKINHVVASLLYHLAKYVIDRGGAAGCDVEKATELRGWARGNLRSGGPDSLHDWGSF